MSARRDAAECGIEGRGEVGTGDCGDDQVVGTVRAVNRAELAEHSVRVGEEVLVHRHLLPVDHRERRALPPHRIGGAAGLVPAQDQQIGDHARARCPLV